MKPAALEDTGWKADALAAIEQQAKTGQPFDAYTLTQAGLRPPPHPNQWGSVFRTARGRGIIEHDGWHQSGRRSRAGGVCSTWVGADSFHARNTLSHTA